MKELTEPQKLWVAALRSGEFKQGKSTLQNHSSGTFCCLGVACVVAEEMGVITRRDRGILKGETLASQPEVFRWIGLINPAGDIHYDETGKYETLWELNDIMEWTFPQIADHIEANADKLFV